MYQSFQSICVWIAPTIPVIRREKNKARDKTQPQTVLCKTHKKTINFFFKWHCTKKFPRNYRMWLQITCIHIKIYLNIHQKEEYFYSESKCYIFCTLSADICSVKSQCNRQWLYRTPSLNTQSCIRGILVVRDFCFWAI